jgi:hypothetical protein
MQGPTHACIRLTLLQLPCACVVHCTGQEQGQAREPQEGRDQAEAGELAGPGACISGEPERGCTGFTHAPAPYPAADRKTPDRETPVVPVMPFGVKPVVSCGPNLASCSCQVGRLARRECTGGRNINPLH